MQQAAVQKFYFFPLKILLSFLIFTCLIFAFGPIMWPVDNPVITYTFLIIVHFALYLGYKNGVKQYKIKETTNRKGWTKMSLFKWSAILYLIWFVPTLLDRWGIGSLSPSLFIDKIIVGMSTPEIGYNAKQDSLSGKGGSIFSYINFFIYGITYMAIPFTFFLWRRLAPWQKVMAILIIFLELVLWIGMGTNKGIIDVLVTSIFMFTAGNWEYVYKNRKKIVIFGLVIISAGIFFFLNNIFSRLSVSGKVNYQDVTIMFTGKREINGNPHNIFIRYFNPITQVAITTIEGYLTIGYYSLSLALHESFTWTYGFGNNWTSMSLWKIFTGQDLLSLTYLGHVDKHYGVDPMVSWHSVYTWFANDVSFLGVPFVIYFIGKFFATAWLDTLHGNSPFAPIISSLFILMVFYFFANNQILSFSFFPFCFSFYMWRKTRN